MGIAYLWALVGIEHIVVLYTYDCVLVENVQVDIGIITRDEFENIVFEWPAAKKFLLDNNDNIKGEDQADSF